MESITRRDALRTLAGGLALAGGMGLLLAENESPADPEMDATQVAPGELAASDVPSDSRVPRP